MELMNITTPTNTAEVTTFDFEANKVCGEKLSKDDAIQICQVVQGITNKGSIITGYYLLALKERADIKELGFKDIYELSKELFGLSKGPTSERIKVAKRFRSDDDSVYAIADKWKDYKYTALLNMKDLTDEQIEEAKISENTLAIEVKSIAEEVKAGEKAESEKEEKPETDEKENSSDSEPTEKEDVSRETPADDFQNIVELKASEIPQSLRVALDKYMRAHKIDTNAILQINMNK